VPLVWGQAMLVLIALGVSLYLARLPEPDDGSGAV